MTSGYRRRFDLALLPFALIALASMPYGLQLREYLITPQPSGGGRRVIAFGQIRVRLPWPVLLAELLKDDEAVWREAACWIDKRALEEGIDLYADFGSPESFSHSLVEGMRFHTDFAQRFPKGLADLERFEVPPLASDAATRE